jgi:mono/diheme cytochrome c family protein
MLDRHILMGHSGSRGRGLLALLMILVLTAGTAALPLSPPQGLGRKGEAAPPSQSASEGQALFQEKCAACHTIGQGDKVGPDLKGVTTRRERAWLTRWIAVPDQMVAQGDPIATELFQKYNSIQMPNLNLTEGQVAALIAYLETQAETGSAAPQPATPQPAPALSPGDPAIGKALFTGSARFQNGGPPCMGCHSITGIGALGGGALGPDLTPAFNKFGAAGLETVLTTLPFPTMNAVWGQRPVTPQEQAHLIAFLQQASVTERPTEVVGQLAGLAVGGAVVLLALAQFTWRRRLTAVRRLLVMRQTSSVARHHV